MIEFADIFGYDLSTAVFMAGSTILLSVYALAALWANREPTDIRASELAPAFGL